MVKKYLKSTLYYVIGIILVGFIFQILSWIKNNDYFLPSIIDVLASFGKLIIKGNTWIAILYTIRNVLLSILLSFAIGILFAVLAYKFKIAYQILKPLMMLFRFIPLIIIINILFYLFYRREGITLYICVCSFLVPMIYESVYQGINSIDKSYIDVYKLNSSFNLIILFRVYLPLAASACKSSFLNSIGLGIKICLSVEFICGLNKTLGFLIKSEIDSYMGYTNVYAYLIILILLSIVLELLPLLIAFIYKKIKYRERKYNLVYDEAAWFVVKYH